MGDGMNVGNSYSAYEPPKGNPATATNNSLATTTDYTIGTSGVPTVADDAWLQVIQQDRSLRQLAETSMSDPTGNLKRIFAQYIEPLFKATEGQLALLKGANDTRLAYFEGVLKTAQSVLQATQFRPTGTA
jgi:hypothetical protein